MDQEQSKSHEICCLRHTSVNKLFRGTIALREVLWIPSAVGQELVHRADYVM